MFEPFRAFSQHLRCFEQSTGEVIELGPHRLVGWTFADGAVSVLPSQGHCAGHVVVYLRDSKVLHLGDEANGPCPVMHDADQHKLTEIQTVARDLLEAGLVDHLSDGHSAAVDDAAQAQARISRLLQQSLDLQDTAAHLSAGSASVDAADFVAGLAQRYDDLHVVSANANPVFVGMMAAEQLQRLGYRRRPYGTRWISRPRSAGATSSLTVLRVLRGLAATVPWRLRGLHRQATNNGS